MNYRFFLFSISISCFSLNGNAHRFINDGINIHDFDFLFVSLGSHCRIAQILNSCNLRKFAFPFDWLLTIDGEKLIELLERDFHDFINNEVPFLIENTQSGQEGLTLINPFYQMEFFHEASKRNNGSYYIDWQKFHSKYQRRINRFRQLEYFKGKVIFIRNCYELSTSSSLTYRHPENIEISEDYSLRLFEAIKKRFPDLDFSLIIINQQRGDEITKTMIAQNLWMTRINNHARHEERQVSSKLTQFFLGFLSP